MLPTTSAISLYDSPSVTRSVKTSRCIGVSRSTARRTRVSVSCATTPSSALYSVTLGAAIAVGSLTLVSYSLAIALARSFGDRLVDRLGRARFIQISAGASAVGMAAALLVGTVPLALIGFALLGLGSGCIVPTVMTLAGNQPDVPSARAVAVIGLGEWPAFLLGPPIIGACPRRSRYAAL